MTPQNLSSAPVPEAPTPPYKPYRYTIEWCSAETGLDNAQVLYDLITYWIEQGCGFPQGGFVQEMELDDVVPESPLAKALDASYSWPLDIRKVTAGSQGPR